MGNETFLPKNRGEIKVFFSLVDDITNHYLCKSEITQNQFAYRIFVSRFLNTTWFEHKQKPNNQCNIISDHKNKQTTAFGSVIYIS